MSPRAKKPRAAKVVVDDASFDALTAAIENPPLPTPALVEVMKPHAAPRYNRAQALEAMERALGEVQLELPISLDYVAAVRARVMELLPGAGVEVFHRHREVVARVFAGGEPVELAVPVT